MSDETFLMAKLRATGGRLFPSSADELTSVRRAAQAACRTLVEVRSAHETQTLTLSLPDDCDPLGQVGIRPYFRPAPSTVLLVLAACLGWCWPDPREAPFPGIAVKEDELLDAMLDLSPSGQSAGARARQVIRGNHRSAVRLLCACGYLEKSLDGSVALGPAVAQWSEADIAALRTDHHRLPSPDRVMS